MSHLLTSYGANKEGNCDIWEYNIGNDANIAHFVCSWKTRMSSFATSIGIICAFTYLEPKKSSTNSNVSRWMNETDNPDP